MIELETLLDIIWQQKNLFMQNNRGTRPTHVIINMDVYFKRVRLAANFDPAVHYYPEKDITTIFGYRVIRTPDVEQDKVIVIKNQ